jgi:hypothetical protein
LEDAYAIADGEIAIEVGGGFTLQRRGSNQGVFPAEHGLTETVAAL